MTSQPDLTQQLTDFLRSEGSRSLDELSALMGNAAADWRSCLDGMSDAQASFNPPANTPELTPWSDEGQGWSTKEVIGHFLFSDRSLNQMIAELAGLPPPEVEVPRVQAMGEQSADDEKQSIDELRRRLDGFFEDTRGLLSSLESKGVPEGAFPHPVFGPLTATEWIAFHRIHSIDHIRQIGTVKSAPGYPAA